MKISRCDLTTNIELSSQDELMEYLRIFKKASVSITIALFPLRKMTTRLKATKTANNRSHCISCKNASFLIYDKSAQLVMIDRYDESLTGKHVLRFEAELKRHALMKHIGKSALETNYKLLSSAAYSVQKVLRWYLKRMQPQCERYLRYSDTAELVRNAGFKKKTEERILYLLRKASDRESLTAALKDLQNKYSLSTSQCKTTLRKFQKLGISPITLQNASKWDELPPIPI